MRWAWVNCLACNPPEDARKAGAHYKHLGLSDAQIAQRAQLANIKAAYQPALSDLAKTTLGGAGQPRYPLTPNESDKKLAELTKSNETLTARLDELLKQNAEMLKSNSEMSQALMRMTVQIGALLEDNAKLRASSVNVIQGASGNMPT